jgi:hypothetical protein
MRVRLLVAPLILAATTLPLVVGGSFNASAAMKVAPFDPVSVSFPSPQLGWALGTLACTHHRRCLTLLETVNASASWFEVQLPARLVKAIDDHGDDIAGLNVDLANEKDGWIYGDEPATIHQGGQSYQGFKSVLWSTHDGGSAWSRQTLPGVSTSAETAIYDVAASSTTVYVLAPKGDGAAVESSPVGENAWRRANVVTLNGPAGGAQPSGEIVLQGAAGWLIYGNDRGTTGSAQLSKRGTWVAWRSPCTAVGHGYAVPAAANAKDLVAVCGMGGFAYPMPTPAPRGATIGSSWLYFSTNGGATFSVGTEIKPVKGNLSFGQFGGVLASPQPGVVILGRDIGNGRDLIASYNGGRSWTVVVRRDVTSLEFPDAQHGVALAELPNHANEMIVTSDGGHRWTPVTF